MKHRELTFAVGGGCIGVLAWQALWTIPLTLGLALLWRCAPSARVAGSAFFGYFALGARQVPEAFAAFYAPDGVWLGWVVWLLHAAVLAAPFAAGKALARRWPRFDALVMLGVLIVFTAPPYGLIGWLSPIFVAGVLFPGAGIAAWGFATLLFAAVASRRGIPQGKLVVVLALLTSLTANLLYQPQSLPTNVVAVSTTLGKLQGTQNARFARNQQLIELVDAQFARGARVIILPEQIAGTWTAANDHWWADVREKARVFDATVLIGADVEIAYGQYRNALIDLVTGQAVAHARMPMPFGLWHPWTTPHWPVSLEASSPITLPILGRAQVVFCYENYLALDALTRSNEATNISVANLWHVGNKSATRIQRLSSDSARRTGFGNLVRATNYQ